MTMIFDALPLPEKVRRRLDAWVEHVTTLGTIHNAKVLASLVPSALRGLIFQRGKQGTPTAMPAAHEAWFDWTYPHDAPVLEELTQRAKAGQWNGDELPWHIDVDLERPDTLVFPIDLVDWELGERLGIHLPDPRDRLALVNDMGAWALAQFLHGEQGALFASAQVTESVRLMDGKLYGATQVMDEARHVEVFARYLQTKIQKLYPVNDNLFTIIDALMTDGRWDMKFLGMQIMVEGLALGAFSTLYQQTHEPLLRELLGRVIQDEARHVHFGVVALRGYIKETLSPREREEREDWAFEIAMLMRDRFLAHEVYEEWFAPKISRANWRKFAEGSPGMSKFRDVMFTRLVPNLREIGLLTDRIRPHYEKAGLMRYYAGRAADQWEASEVVRAA